MNKVTENYKIIATCHPDTTQCTLILMHIIVKTLQSNIKASCCDCSVAFHDNLTLFFLLLFLLTPDFLEESGYFTLCTPLLLFHYFLICHGLFSVTSVYLFITLSVKGTLGQLVLALWVFSGHGQWKKSFIKFY